MENGREFDFTLLLSGISDFTDEQIESLYEAGCDDATVAQRHGRVYVTFSRHAVSAVEAIVSAIENVKKSDIGASVQRVDTCNLVTQAEIARRIGRSRELVSKYATGERGAGGFPAPACNIVEGKPLWYWCEVAYWFSQNHIIKDCESREAQEIAAINTILELEHFKEIAPEVTSELFKQFSVCNGFN